MTVDGQAFNPRSSRSTQVSPVVITVIDNARLEDDLEK